MKKSQGLSVFFIVALVILIGFLFFINNYFKVNIENDYSPSLINIKEETKLYVESCLEVKTIEAVELFGLLNIENNLSAYLESNLEPCLSGFEQIKKRGYDVSFEKPKVNLSVNEEIIIVDLFFPLKISKEGKSTKITDFQYKLKTARQIKTEDNFIKDDTFFFSSDKNLILKTEEDTKIQGNNLVNSVSFKLLDKHFDGLSNGVVIGNVVYEGLPEDISFDPPVRITIKVRKELLPAGFSKDLPQIAWYDKKHDIWRPYSSLPFSEDEKYYYYAALVNHFSDVAVVMCSSNYEQNSELTSETVPIQSTETQVQKEGEVMFNMGFVYKQRINPSFDSYWNYKKVKQADSEKKLFLIPEIMGVATCSQEINMFYNNKQTCKEMLKDWDEDDKNSNIMVDYACEQDCKYKVKEFLNCYFNNIGCDTQGIKYTTEQSLYIDPYKYKIEEKEADINLISVDGIKDSATLSCDSSDISKCGINSLQTSKIDIVNYEKEKIESFQNKYPIKNTIYDDNTIFATPKTYGYENANAVGGKGYFVFEVEGNGNGCIDTVRLYGSEGNVNTEDPIETNNLLSLTAIESGECSPGDSCFWYLNNQQELSAFSDVDTSSLQRGVVQSGKNYVSVDVINTGVSDRMGYAEAYASGVLLIKGSGLIEKNIAEEGGGLGGGGGESESELSEGMGGTSAYTGEFGEIFKGVTLAKPEDIPGVVYYVVKIDLSSENEIGFMVTPEIAPEVKTTSSFLAENKAQLGINGCGFDIGGSNQIKGYYASYQGVPYKGGTDTPGNTICISEKNDVSFDCSPDPYYGVSGFQAVVVPDKSDRSKGALPDYLNPVDSKEHSDYLNLEPRTSVGIREAEEKGKMKAVEMIIIVVDGRSDLSRGVDLVELGELHIKYGSTKAINMDGGGSSTLVVEEGTIPKIVNVPSDGSERAVANHLIIFAKKGENGGIENPDPNLVPGNCPSGGSSGTTIANFRTISSEIAAGAQPTKEGYSDLYSKGYNTVVDLQGCDNSASVSAAGLKYIHMPYPGGSVEDIRKWIKNVKSTIDSANKNVFFHCQWGVHRTGAIEVAYKPELCSSYKNDACPFYPELYEAACNSMCPSNS